MDIATFALIAIVAALVFTLYRSQNSIKSLKSQPKLGVVLKPASSAAVLAPRGSTTLLEDSKSGGGNAAAMVASSSVAYDLA